MLARGVVWGLVAALITAAPLAGTGNAADMTAIAVSYPGATAIVAPLIVAKDEGFFARHGLNVSLHVIAPNVSVAAMEAGEIQIASAGGPNLINADLAGASAVMVVAGCDYPAFSLYGAKGIMHVHDLVGKTIAVTTIGGSSETSARLFFEHFGLQGRIKIMPTGGSNATSFAALANGVVAGAMLSAPATKKAETQGFVELVNGITLGIPLTLNGVAVTRSYLRQHRDVVERFLLAYRDAWTFLRDPSSEPVVERVLARYLKVPLDMAEASYEYYYPIWAGKKLPTVDRRGIANSLRFALNPKAKEAKPEDFFDNSILESLQ